MVKQGRRDDTKHTRLLPLCWRRSFLQMYPSEFKRLHSTSGHASISLIISEWTLYSTIEGAEYSSVAPTSCCNGILVGLRDTCSAIWHTTALPRMLWIVLERSRSAEFPHIHYILRDLSMSQVRHALCRQPYGTRILCTHISIFHRRMNTKSTIFIEWILLRNYTCTI
jgi:hypothetical protein